MKRRRKQRGKMAKLTAWLVTIIGLFLVLSLLGVQGIGTAISGLLGWLIALAVLVIGIGKLMRNYSKKRK
jgi:membrane protein required for beta-lactamase induction